MNENRASIEMMAPTVEEAVAKGLEELGLTADEVEVEVLDAGSRGLFGLGSRQARVRLMLKAARGNISLPVVSAAPPAVGDELGADEPVAAPAEAAAERKPARRREGAAPAKASPAKTPPAITPPAAPPPAITPAVQSRDLTPEEEMALRVARDTVSELLDKMKVRAQVTAHYGQPDEPNGKLPLWVDVRGNDLSILIGPKSETLNALQYIANLIASKEIGHSIPMIVDVEGFRSRREQQLRQLARRMAEQAIKTGRRQVLEPMPASERRLIHIELRANEQVTTESEGEDPRRKVTIIPKAE